MQEHTVSEPSGAKPTWTSPPRQGERTPAGTAEFVICDHTIESALKTASNGWGWAIMKSGVGRDGIII